MRSTSLAAALAAALAAFASQALAAAAVGDAWILRCQVDSATTGVRTFRIAPKLLQEWSPSDHGFGPNLCLSFACKVDRDRLEGAVSSASLILTLSVDRKTGQGSWRTVGASGMKQTSGTCQAEREKPGVKLD